MAPEILNEGVLYFAAATFLIGILFGMLIKQLIDKYAKK